MRPTTKKLLAACGLYLAIQIPGAAVSVVYGLPAEFTFGKPRDPDDVLGGILAGEGAALVAPPPPLIALIVFMALALSRRWWGAIGTAGICLLSPFVVFALFMEPVVGRVFPPTAPELPIAFTVALLVVVPLLMLLSGILDLIARVRTRKGEQGLSGRVSSA